MESDAPAKQSKGESKVGAYESMKIKTTRER